MTSALETFKQELQSLEIQGKAPNDISIMKLCIAKYEQYVSKQLEYERQKEKNINPKIRELIKVNPIEILSRRTAIKRIIVGEVAFFNSKGQILVGIIWEANVPEDDDYDETLIKMKLPTGGEVEIKAKDILPSDGN